ncbi:unannotated protein [freshwater metagenome]|uniref:Unannotated protein n=1 Tax=freshwater metagenome TaxID=449393 RepID=A0A6J6T7W0_9ZZZZ
MLFAQDNMRVALLDGIPLNSNCRTPLAFCNASECARFGRETGRLSTFHDNNVRIHLQLRRSRPTASQQQVDPESRLRADHTALNLIGELTSILGMLCTNRFTGQYPNGHPIKFRDDPSYS